MIQLSEIFCDRAVLQRRKEIRIFGTADGEVTVSFAGKTVRAGSKNGFFTARFPAMEAGGPYEITAVCGDTGVCISDIMIGDVFIISGQSNAELPISETDDADTYFDSRNDVRYFKMPGFDKDEYLHLVPLITPFDDKWVSLTSDQAKQWSAIGLFTGLHFADNEGITVGIIAAFRGATGIQAFLPFELCAKYPYDFYKIHPDHRLCTWNVPSLLYRTMIYPLFPLSFRAVVWYQGETNSTEFECRYYKDMLKDMILDWRKRFEDDALPFAVVQINRYPKYEVSESWAAVMQAQADAVKETQHTALVKIDDMGIFEKIHPTNKRQVSERICKALEELEK